MNYEMLLLIVVFVAVSITIAIVVARHMSNGLADRINQLNNRIESVVDRNEQDSDKRFTEVYRTIDQFYQNSERQVSRNAMIQELESCIDKKEIRSIVEKYM